MSKIQTIFDLKDESLMIDIEDAMSAISDRERLILKMHFGLGCNEITLARISEQFLCQIKEYDKLKIRSLED